MSRLFTLLFLISIYLPRASFAQVAGYEGKRLNAGVDLSFINCLVFTNKNHNHGPFSFIGSPNFYLGYAITDRINLEIGYGFEQSSIALTQNQINNANDVVGNEGYDTRLNFQLSGNNIYGANYYNNDFFAYFKNYTIDIKSNIFSLNLEYYPGLNIPLVGNYIDLGFKHYAANLSYDSNDFYNYQNTTLAYSGYTTSLTDGTIYTPGSASFGTISATSINVFTVGWGVKRIIKGRIILDFAADFGLNFGYMFTRPFTSKLNNVEKGFLSSEDYTSSNTPYTDKGLNEWENNFIKKSVKERLRAQSTFRLKFGIGFLID